MSMSTSEFHSNFPPNPSSYRKDSGRRFASPPATTYRRDEVEHESTNAQVHHIRKWYESRVKGLSDDIRNAFTLVQSDALIDTMKHDTASEEYISQRVKEIIEDCLSNDRELLLEKMALQNAYLKGEFSNSEQENLKIINELNNRLERMQEEYRNEAQAREYFEREVQNLKYGTDELTKSYENTLRMTEDEIHKKAEQDRIQIRNLEGRLKEGEDRYFEMTQKQSALQKELENVRNQMKEAEIEKNKVQEKFKSATGIIEDYEKLENEMKRTINSLKEEILDVKANLSTVVLQKKEMENKYKRIIDEISNENEEKDEKVQKAHKEKIEQYKRKVIEYKERLGEKERELRDLRERHEDNDHKKQRNIDLLENKIQEQRNYYEEMARSLEEENYRRTTELKERNEEELREVEAEFKRLLDEKLAQLQEESDEQITEFKKQEREVQLLLEERNKEMERDYIPLKHHEKVIEEKNALLQTLKEELKRMELENRQKVSMRLKSLEERLFTEHNAQVKVLKLLIDEKELQIKELNDQNKIIEQELKLVSEERRALGDSVQQLELQKRKLHESAEEWAEKSRRVKAAYEEEQGRNNELERELRRYQEKYNETINQLEETVIEVEERRSEVANLNNEVNTLGMSLKGSSKERKKLDQELSELNRNLLEAQERIRRLEEENSGLKEENVSLEEKVKEILTVEEEKYTKEANEHVKTKLRLQSAEDQVVLMENEIDDNRDKIDEMKGQLEDIERRNEELERSNEVNKEKMERLQKEKRASERNVDQILIRITAWRRANEDKLDFMRKEMEELKSVSNAQVNSLIRENEMAILKLVERVNSILDAKARKFQQEKEELAAQMEMEFNQNYGALRAEYEDKYLDLQESFELKSLEHERQLEYKDGAYGRLMERANELSKELERRDLRQAQTDNELNRTRKAKEEASMTLDQTTLKLTKELDITKEDLRRATEEAERARKEMEEKYSAEKELLNKEIEKFSEDIKSYEDKLRSLMTEHEDEKLRSTKEFQETKGQLKASLKASKGAEDMLIMKVSKLEQRINELKRVEIDVRRENEYLKTAYEKRVEEFENKMNEIMKTMEEGEEAMATFRQDKIQEMNQYLGTIHLLQEEVTMKNDRVNKLLEERDRFEVHLKEIESEVMKKANQFDEEKQELMGLTTAQAQEIEQLHMLLSSSYRPSSGKDETGGAISSTRKREVKGPETSKHVHLGVNRLKSNLSRTEKQPDYYSNSTPTMRMEKEKARTIHPYNQENKYHSANRDSDRSRRK